MSCVAQPDPVAVEEFCRRAAAAFAPPRPPDGLLHVPHADGRAAFTGALRAFAEALSNLDDAHLLAPSRCAGWSALDVAAHVHLGLQEMLLGVVSPTDEAPDVDAATYWRSFPPTNDAAADGTDGVLFVRRLASAYRRPAGLVRHLRVTAEGIVRATAALPDGAVAFQGHVLTTGDFLATWAVELAVHHLDVHGDPDASALALARRTVEALAGRAAPAGTDDTTLVLAGTGRIPPGGLTGLPVMG